MNIFFVFGNFHLCKCSLYGIPSADLLWKRLVDSGTDLWCSSKMNWRYIVWTVCWIHCKNYHWHTFPVYLQVSIYPDSLGNVLQYYGTYGQTFLFYFILWHFWSSPNVRIQNKWIFTSWYMVNFKRLPLCLNIFSTYISLTQQNHT